MAEGTATMEQQTTGQQNPGGRAQRVMAARAYQKTHLTEGTEEELLQSYAPVISQMVHRFAPLVRVSVDVDDLKNIASLALIQAAHGYDPGQGMSFASYARMRIRGAILDEIRKSQPLTRTEYSRRKELENTIEALRLEFNRQPTEEEIAGRMGIALGAYRALLDKLRPVIFVPLHQMLEGEDEFGGGPNDFQSADVNAEDPSETAGRHELHTLIRDRIGQLNRQQQKVLLLFYYEGLRMKDIAELMNISESRVCQVNTEAVLSLRSFLQRQEKI